MNVFVLGTGRCGTTTFAKACKHITNYTTGHEMLSRSLDGSILLYPDKHIEVDAHLSAFQGLLMNRYPDAFYVHLERKSEEVVESYIRRGILLHRGAAPLVDVIFQTKAKDCSRAQYRKLLSLLCDSINANIRAMTPRADSMHIWLHDIKQGFEAFWYAIQAKGDLDAALLELNIRYNASR